MTAFRIFRISVLALAGLCTAVAVSGCKKADAAADGGGGAMPPAAVAVAPAISADVPVYLDEIGRIVSMDSVSVIPQIDGLLTAAHVSDGDEVKKGQLLFELDPRPFQAAYDSAKAELEEAKSNLELANIENNRVVALKDTQAVSQQEMDQDKTTVDGEHGKGRCGPSRFGNRAGQS